MVDETSILKLKLIDIKVAKRFRQSIGDVAELAESIQRLGLIHPIAVAEDMTLIAGRRRLAAFTSLGREYIPAVVLPLDENAQRDAERDENQCRKDLSASDKVAVMLWYEDREREAAKGRRPADQVEPERLPTRIRPKSVDE